MLAARAESASPHAQRPARATAEERDLVKRMRSGDESAFEWFADHYIPALSRFAASRLGTDREAITEVVQATVCKAIEKLDSYRGEAPLFTWLCACCRNEIFAHFRRRRYLSDEGIPPVETTDLSPEDLFLVAESTGLVHLALDHLPPRYAAALKWKYIEGFSVSDIAVRLQLGAKATESLLSRARAQLRKVYEQLSSRVRY